MRHLRFDFSSLEPAKRLPNGRLITEGYLARTGILEYTDSNGARKEYRPPDEVFRPDSIASFEGVPLTDNHPTGLLNANAKGHVVGTITKVRREDDKIKAQIVVFDKSTIEKMEKGKIHLSAGYQVDLDRTPGVTPQGEKYDAVQRMIFADHVALVEKGRAGPEVRIRMDSNNLISDRKAITVYNSLLARR